MLAQPYRAYVKTLLERQRYPARRVPSEAPRRERPYDVAGWTLPAQMGVDVRTINRAFTAGRWTVSRARQSCGQRVTTVTVARARGFAEPVLPDGCGPRPRPTIRNVAERAGVSKSLVSLVLRGSPHVSEHRRQAVLQAARELGYRPNAVARSLVEGRTHLIGALVADLHNPFYAEFLDGLQESLHGDGLRMLIGNSQWDPAFEDEAVEAFLELRVDGLVLLGIAPTSETLIEATAYTPDGRRRGT